MRLALMILWVYFIVSTCAFDYPEDLKFPALSRWETTTAITISAIGHANSDLGWLGLASLLNLGAAGKKPFG